MLLIIITVIDPFFVYSQENSNDNNPLNIWDLFNTLKKNIFNLTKSLEYNIEIDSNQMFPNIIYDPEKDKLSIYVQIYVAVRYLLNWIWLKSN